MRDQEVISAGLLVPMGTCGTLILGKLVAESFVSGSATSWLSPWTAICVTVGSIGTALVDYGYAYHLTRGGIGLPLWCKVGRRSPFNSHGGGSLPYFLISVHRGFLVYVGVSFLSGFCRPQSCSKETTPGLGQKPCVAASPLFMASQASVAAVLSLYEGTFLLILMNQCSETGVFGVGLTFSLGFFGIYVAFYEYFFPRMVRTANVGLLPQVLVRTIGGALLVILGCQVLTPAIGASAPYLIKPALWGGVPVFYCLAASMLFSILQSLFEAACQYLLRPGLVVFVWIVRILWTALLGFVLAPVRGAMGLALAQAGASAIGLIVIVPSTLIALHSAMHHAPQTEAACLS